MIGMGAKQNAAVKTASDACSLLENRHHLI